MSGTNDTGPEGVDGEADGPEEPAVTDTGTDANASDGTASQKPSNGEESGAKPAGWPGIS
ncbi:hypothetical protein [Streptomyces sp. NRRL F-5126]|uniref:hypothetical protein n=1 Tax=Streptomyces sp. NRRL F-5126 TaxID=1463857 RepID=UPI0004C55CF2|nr:hypothetical protein [Streptomyces sp. NRRL F-5126]